MLRKIGLFFLIFSVFLTANAFPPELDIVSCGTDLKFHSTSDTRAPDLTKTVPSSCAGGRPIALSQRSGDVTYFTTAPSVSSVNMRWDLVNRKCSISQVAGLSTWCNIFEDYHVDFYVCHKNICPNPPS